MLSTRHSGPEYSHRLTSRITIAARAFIVFALAVIAFEFLAFPTHPVYASSGSLSLGTVATPVPLTPCPGNGWYSYVNNGQNVPMNCFTSTVQNCPDAQDLSLTFGYLSPAGIIPGNVKGVIVFLNGGNGTQPEGPATGSSNANEFDMIDYDFRQGYEVVQLAWQYSWEQTSVPSMGGPSIRPNVQDAACRPATFLNYVYTNIYQSVAQSNATAGMCAQGDSAGSAAVVYSMTYYGAASYLDNVELISGPVLSDIKQGCEESAPGPVAVCPTGQYGCQLGTGGSSWSVEPTYLTGASGGVRNWTDDQSCAVPGGHTSGASNAAWLQQSIVDQGTGATPSFSYPNTAMSAWLCRSIKGGYTQAQCAASYDPDLCPNNSSPQGEIFYAQIGQSNSPPSYNVYAVDQCGGPEGSASTGSNVPGYNPSQNPNGISGFHAVTQDMVFQCTHPH